MADTARDAKLTQYLNEAYAKEKELETALTAHIGMTTRKTYEKRLRDHLKETKDHARQLEQRIKQISGGGPATVGAVALLARTKAAKAMRAHTRVIWSTPERRAAGRSGRPARETR